MGYRKLSARPRDAEFLEDPLRQIDQPPAHHAMHRRDRATLDHAGDGLPLSVVELGRLSCRLAIQETVRTAGVEAQHPVPDDLKSDTADLGRLGARCPSVDSRAWQKPASLRPVFGLPCQTANLWRIKSLAQWCRSRHDEPPGSAMLNLTRLHLGIAHESQFQGLGIRGTAASTATMSVGWRGLRVLDWTPGLMVAFSAGGDGGRRSPELLAH